jgi:hypothetical protein
VSGGHGLGSRHKKPLAEIGRGWKSHRGKEPNDDHEPGYERGPA